MYRPCSIRLASFALFVALLPLGGCKDSPSVASVKWELERNFPDTRFEREFHIRLGRFSLGLTKSIARWALDDDDEARVILTNLKRVEVGVYRVVSLPDPEELKRSYDFEKLLERKGWISTVRVADGGEQTWVFHREDDRGQITGLFVAALDGEELTLVSLEGQLDRVMAAALADDPGEFIDLLDS